MATTLALPPQTDAVAPAEQFGGIGYPQLDEDLQKALKDLVRKALQREMYARRQEVMEARKQRFYDRGIQYIYWDYSAWGFAPLSAGSSAPGDNGTYEDVYNIYHPFLRATIAAGTANPPGIHIVARTNKMADTIGSQAADLYREFVEQANDIKRIQTEIWRFFGTDGRVVTEAVKSKPSVKYGVDDDGEPLEAELIEVNGVLESKMPITQNDMKDWPYCVLSREFEIEKLQEEYPDAVDKEGNSLIKDSGDAMGESSYERMARIGVLQGTRMVTASGETWTNLATRHRAYFRPDFFRAAPKPLQDRLKQAFPKGCLVVICGDAYCESFDVSMDERLSVGHSTPGDGQNRSSLMHDMVGPQDTFNDCWNQQKEIFDYCIPQVYMDAASLDAMAREEQTSEPGAEVPIVLQPGEDINSKIMFGQNVEVPETLIHALETLSGPLGQLITGMYAPAMGAGDEHQETAKGLTILKESTLGQIGVGWGASQEILASSIEQCIRLGANTRDSTQKIPVRSKGSDAKVIEVANIQKGNWYAEKDTSYPDTRAMKRAIFTSLIEMSAKSPAIAAMLALPENQELFKEFVGIPEFEVPGAAAGMQQRREIEKLLQSDPIPPTEQEVQAAVQQMAQKAAATMQPGEPLPPPPDPKAVIQSLLKPSVPIDPIWDMHQLHFQTVQDWLATQARFDEEAKGNVQGIENVKLHGMEHKKIMDAMQQPPQSKPPSESINYKDLPPDGKVQLAAKAGITLNPTIMAAQAISEHASKPAPGAPNA